MCYYFDDILVDMLYADYIKMGWISPTEYDTIKHWHEKLASYQSPNNQYFENAAVLNDPKWQAIVKEEQAACLNLLTVLDKEERDALMGRTSVTLHHICEMAAPVLPITSKKNYQRQELNGAA